MPPYLTEHMRQNSPDYMDAYEKGYEQAKRDIQQILKTLQAFKDFTSTTLEGDKIN